ncbi:MAG: hypothetical protein DBY32_02035 [Phascolarctobacterium sp.]|nr:MAG: hypothetical protein DBY32_02035 [Phascolarctobacterium sp.]
MNLIGRKVILRAIEEEDLELFRNMLNSPELENLIVPWYLPISQKDQCEWFKNTKNNLNHIRYVIALKENDKAIGTIGLFNIDWKNGYVYGTGIRIFENNYRKQGIGYDSLMTLLKYAFEELRLNRIDFEALANNNASINLYLKAGFKREGLKRKMIYKNGQFNDVVIGGCLKTDYEEKLKKSLLDR